MKDGCRSDPARRRLLAALPSAAMALGWPVSRAQTTTRTLVIARTASFKSLDPVRAFEDNSSVLQELAYSTLLSYSWLERPYRMEPDLLERMPERAADGLSYRFTLRRGVMFHDDPCFAGGKGRELVADDVLFNLRRFADARLNQESWFLLEDMVVGLDEYRAATLKAAADADLSEVLVPGLQRLDSRQFTIRLKRASAHFLYALASPATGIVAPEAVRFHGERLSTHPVGTGPFRMTEFERKGVIRWARHAAYHRSYPSAGEPADIEAGLLKAAGRRLPFVDTLEMPLIEETQPLLLKFQRGELDIAALDRAGIEKMLRRENGRYVLQPDYAQRYALYQAARLTAMYLWINQKDPLLGRNKALRQAIAHLLDIQGDIETVQRGAAFPLGSVVPLLMAGGERDTGAVPFAYDPARAKALLAQAGFPDGRGLPELTVSCGFSGVEWRNRFDFHRARFAAAGVRLKSNFTDQPTFIKAVEASNFQLAFYGWVADYPDAENFYQLLASRNAAPGPNLASFGHADYDRAYEATRFMANEPERYAQFRRMNDVVRDEVPLVPMYNSVRVGLRQNWVRNHKYHALISSPAPYLDLEGAPLRR
jgi:oligopeptide transport system substrate-binding protein